MEQIEYIIGNEERLKQMPNVCAWKPFDKRAIDFCGKLSSALIQNKNCQNYPDLITLIFWLRNSNIRKCSLNYADLADHLGRGLVFHIAPGNVALSFAYSLATGLLTGNTNIIRLPSRKFIQAEIFCKTLENLLSNESEIADRICLIRYPHDKSITDKLSALCHTRIIWGGNTTVNIIRQSPLPPRATEITFANRFSICLIDADVYLSDYDAKKTAHDFYIDTYLTDQNACSSPRIILWMGEKKKEAQDIFWNALDKEISNYNLEAVTTVDKVLTFCKYAAENQCKLILGSDYKIMRIKVKALNQNILYNIGNSGLFYEYEISELCDILPICTWELQTISYIGMKPDILMQFVLLNAPNGIDRIVEAGHTMDFGFVWDGRDVVREMTRQITLK